jgi:hypothetical protein
VKKDGKSDKSAGCLNPFGMPCPAAAGCGMLRTAQLGLLFICWQNCTTALLTPKPFLLCWAIVVKGTEQPTQACMLRCPAEAPRRAHLVQCGGEGEPLVEPDNCSHAILVREGQHAVGSPPPALAALPAYCNCFSARWPGLQSVHMDTELEPRCTQTGLPLRKHAGSTGLAGSSCSRCRKGWLQLMVTAN